jgi:fatty-acid desaturase
MFPHVFPPSAYHGLGRQVDVSGICISAFERVGLASDVRRVTGGQQARKRPPDAGISRSPEARW